MDVARFAESKPGAQVQGLSTNGWERAVAASQSIGIGRFSMKLSPPRTTRYSHHTATTT